MRVLSDLFEIEIVVPPKVELYGTSGAEERVIVDLKFTKDMHSHYVQIRVYNTASSMDFSGVNKYFLAPHKPSNKPEINFEHLGGKTAGEFFATEIMDKVVKAIENLVDLDVVNEYVRKLSIEGVRLLKNTKPTCNVCNKAVNEKSCLKCHTCKSSMHVSCGKKSILKENQANFSNKVMEYNCIQLFFDPNAIEMNEDTRNELEYIEYIAAIKVPEENSPEVIEILETVRPDSIDASALFSNPMERSIEGTESGSQTATECDMEKNQPETHTDSNDDLNQVEPEHLVETENGTQQVGDCTDCAQLFTTISDLNKLIEKEHEQKKKGVECVKH